MPSTLILAVCIISFTSTVMAVDRYIAVCRPHSSLRLNITKSFIAIACVWFASLLACVPIFLSYRVRDETVLVPSEFMENSTEPGYLVLTKCEEYWPSEFYRRSFSMAVLIIQFVLPAMIIAYCYISIFKTIRNQRKFRRHNASRSLMSRKEISRSKSNCGGPNSSSNRLIRTTMVLVAMIAIFMACWMPINVLLLIADHSQVALWESTRWFSLAYFSSHLLAMTSTLWNPLLYGFLNERLRPELLKICCSKKRGTSSNSVRNSCNRNTTPNRSIIKKKSSNEESESDKN